MLEALKSLFENNAILEEIRAEIQDAWTQKVEENKLSVTAESNQNLLRSMNTTKQI